MKNLSSPGEANEGMRLLYCHIVSSFFYDEFFEFFEFATIRASVANLVISTCNSFSICLLYNDKNESFILVTSLTLNLLVLHYS